MHSETREVGGHSAFQYRVHVKDAEMVDKLVESLEQVDDVVKVIRADMDDMLHDSVETFWANAEE